MIIKYWYGNNSKNYYHWIDVLGLSEPAERNWIGEEKVFKAQFIFNRAVEFVFQNVVK